MKKQTANNAEKNVCARTTPERHIAIAKEEYCREFFKGRRTIGATGFQPTGPTCTLLHLMQDLVGSDVEYYLTEEEYRLIGLRQTDPQVIRDPHHRHLHIVGLTGRSDMANMSILCKKDILWVPTEGGRAIPRKEYKNYTLIHQGRRHLDTIMAANINSTLFGRFQKAGVIDAGVAHHPSKVYDLHLHRVARIAPSNWSGLAHIALVDLMREEKYLEDMQTPLGKRVEEAKPKFTGTGHPLEGATYYPKEEIVTGLPIKPYIANCREYRYMGHSKLSFDFSELDYCTARDQLKEVRRRLRDIRYFMNAILIAAENSSSNFFSWSDPLTTHRGEHEKIEEIASIPYITPQGDETIVKIKRSRWHEAKVSS